ncbi:MAG: hypothetical protein PQJ61_02420 [Spirochaetales bacterium]|uniref:ATP-binding protein n=1 Tax=Candidatus Thalassospirochaeta sargassi TaxID=3119039 RepID=A0AAJ1IDV0_9SPIO|nr:hypothetical protein [Spirochaetales bacterium]
MLKEDRRVRIICGHYGSGKTEFAVNYAVKLAAEGGHPMLADIDVINPYFRSRERSAELEKLGVRVAASSTSATSLDLPSISAGVYSAFDDHSTDAVIDIGGDKGGITVLNRFSDHFSSPAEYDLFFIINAYREATKNASQITDYIDIFENTCGLKVSGLINNTHMLKSTVADDIINGYRLAFKVSEKTGIPLRYNSGMSGLYEKLPEEIKSRFFPMELFMRDDWMS